MGKKNAPPVVESSEDTIYNTRRTGPYYGYDQEAATEICTRIATGEALVKICRDEAMPCVGTVYAWLRENANFRELYRIAREDQADTLADELIQIAEEEPDPVRARLKCDVRKWIASKLKPVRYGDKIDLTARGEGTITAIRRIIVDDGADIEGVEVHRAQALESVSLLPDVGRD